MNERAALDAAWEACDADAVRALLKGKNVLDYLYLVERGIRDEKDGLSLHKVIYLPNCLRVFMEETDEQNIALIEVERIAVICRAVAEMCGPSRRGPVMWRAHALQVCAQTVYPYRERKCRDALRAFLAYAPSKDVARAWARHIWREKRRAAEWGDPPRKPPEIFGVPIQFVLVD